MASWIDLGGSFDVFGRGLSGQDQSLVRPAVLIARIFQVVIGGALRSIGSNTRVMLSTLPSTALCIIKQLSTLPIQKPEPGPKMYPAVSG